MYQAHILKDATAESKILKHGDRLIHNHIRMLCIRIEFNILRIHSHKIIDDQCA